MNCACENRKRAMEYERTRRLATALAKIEDAMVVIYRKEDGTFTYCLEDYAPCGVKIHEYVTPY